MMSIQPVIILYSYKCISQPLRTSLIISLLLVLTMNIQMPTVYSAQNYMHAFNSYTVSGTVFDDYNQNGTQDWREPGLNGVIVTAYNSTNVAVASTTTATYDPQNGILMLGKYSLNIPDGTGPVRLQ